MNGSRLLWMHSTCGVILPKKNEDTTECPYCSERNYEWKLMKVVVKPAYE